MIEHVCYTVNRKSGYLKIFNDGNMFPLFYAEEVKKENNFTWQEVADYLYSKYKEDDK